jgi:hypothetical protein
VYNYHKTLKALLNRARRMGKIATNPYELLRGQFKRGDKENTEYLTEEEMTRIRTLSLPKGSTLDIAKDLFIFQMFTGLAYSDAEAFDFKRYKKVDGTWRYVGKRIKMKGVFSSYYDDVVKKRFYGCVIADALACCSQGLAFELAKSRKYPEEFPDEGTQITIIGDFDYVVEEGEDDVSYAVIRNAKMSNE